MQHLIPFSITELMHDFFFFYSPEMCCHKNVCDLRLKKWKCRGDLWNVSLFRGVFYYLHWARCWCQEPHTAHTHTHSSILCTYRGQNVIQAAHPSVIPPHGGRCTDCKYHSHTQLHVGKKHTSDRPPSIIPHLQQTTSPFPWQRDSLRRTRDRCAGATGDSCVRQSQLG